MNSVETAIVHYFGLFVTSFIIIAYGLSAYWHIDLLRKTVWGRKSFVILHLTIGAVLFILTHIYLLIDDIFFSSVHVASFGMLVIRPLILLMGCFLAASARVENTIAKGGCNHWIRKYKTLSDG